MHWAASQISELIERYEPVSQQSVGLVGFEGVRPKNGKALASNRFF